MSGPCPSCRGNPREEVDGEVYVCPDCAGTGKAVNSISANERLRDAAPRLADALKQWQQWASEWGSTVTRSLPLNDAANLGRAIRATKAALREAGVS